MVNRLKKPKAYKPVKEFGIGIVAAKKPKTPKKAKAAVAIEVGMAKTPKKRKSGSKLNKLPHHNFWEAINK